MRILLTCYYGLCDALKLAADALVELGHTVIGYPLFKYYADVNDKNTEYVQMFNEFIKNSNIDVILWWYFAIPTCDMKMIIQNNIGVKNIMFNWDEPYNWFDNDIKNKAQFFDIVFVTCAERLDDYIKYGTKKAILQFPGYDSKFHNIILHDVQSDYEKYSCDISMCCTNLYNNDNLYPNQYIKRKTLIDKIYENQEKYNYSFKIYGPEHLKTYYPKSYSGYVKYENTNKVYNYSKINICTHVQCDTYKYLNERTITILGSGGLLLIDRVKGIEELLIPDVECVILDKDKYMEQILEILQNYDKYLIIRHNGYLKSKIYTWNKWAENLHKHLTEL